MSVLMDTSMTSQEQHGGILYLSFFYIWRSGIGFGCNTVFPCFVDSTTSLTPPSALWWVDEWISILGWTIPFKFVFSTHTHTHTNTNINSFINQPHKQQGVSWPSCQLMNHEMTESQKACVFLRKPFKKKQKMWGRWRWGGNENVEWKSLSFYGFVCVFSTDNILRTCKHLTCQSYIYTSNKMSQIIFKMKCNFCFLRIFY